MPITLEQAKKLKHGDIIHFGKCTCIRGSRGGHKNIIERWRITGKIRLWKRSPHKFMIPTAHGLYTHWYLDEHNASAFHTELECPLIQESITYNALALAARRTLKA